MNPLEEPLKMKPMDEEEIDSGDESDAKPTRRSGRRKIKIEYIEDKNRRHITFSKRKAGIMKKAYELSTLTGTQVLLLVVSETGLVYTFTTVKLQPIVTKPEGKNLIQACLNAPDPIQNEASENDTGYQGQQRLETEKKPTYDEKKVEAPPAAPAPQQAPPAGGPGYSNGHYQQPQQPVYGSNGPMPPMPPNNGYNHPSYMNSPYQPPQQQPPQQQQQNQPPQQPSPQQQQQQTPYGQMPGPGYYANQQVPPQYMQQQQQGYWAGNNPSMPRHQEDDKSRLTPKKELK